MEEPESNNPVSKHTIYYNILEILILDILAGLNAVYSYTLFMQLFQEPIRAHHLNGLSTVLRSSVWWEVSNDAQMIISSSWVFLILHKYLALVFYYSPFFFCHPEDRDKVMQIESYDFTANFPHLTVWSCQYSAANTSDSFVGKTVISFKSKHCGNGYETNAAPALERVQE